MIDNMDHIEDMPDREIGEHLANHMAADLHIDSEEYAFLLEAAKRLGAFEDVDLGET